MIHVYAVQHLLKGRDLLEPEIEQLRSWKAEAETAIKAIQDVDEANPNELTELAVQYLVNFNEKLADDDAQSGSGAIAMARASQRALLGGENEDQLLEQARVTIAILETELGITSMNDVS